MSKIKVKIEKNNDGIVIRQFLKEEMGLSTRLIRSASIEKRILVNDEPVRMRKVLKAGDIVEIELNRDEKQNITPENIPLDIIYEDDDILVVNKPPFMVVHPTKSHQSGTLANGILYYFNESKQNCIVRLVSRLDMNTSGLIIIAKNQFAHMALSREMQNNNLEKRYIAIVHGHLKEENGTIDAPIYKLDTEEDSFKRVVDNRGQRSITHYRVIQRLKDSDVVECLLETGRTHQIRVHLSHLGHPIYGDTLYGYGEEEEEKELIDRQALHACKLKFNSPRTKLLLDLEADIPEDMKKLISKLQ